MASSENESEVMEFYKGKSVFITGATGFMGKVLIEKLLRSCRDVKKIYLLVRQKRGKSIEQRTQKLFSEELFVHLKEENPAYIDKITIVSGDACEPCLGLSDTDRKLLIENVNIVFHTAATVNFDEKIKTSVNINIKGVRELLQLCREMKDLKAVVHVSTAYSNCQRKEIDEKVYESRFSSDALIQMTEIMPDDLLDSVTPQLIGEWPNTYAFTKQVAEDCINRHGKGLPIAIFRPSIIIGSHKEPVPGWIDNLYGPNGVIIAVGTGILRVVLTDTEKTADLIPVDYCVNALITLAWDLGTKRTEEPETIPVYNFVSSCDNPITWGEYFRYNMNYGVSYPSNRAIWYYTLTMTTNRFLFTILTFLYHTIPAALMDLCLIATNNKRKMLETYTKIHKFLEVITFFSTQQWKFKNENVKSLWNKLNETDQRTFNFDISPVSWKELIKESIFGLRKYLLKEDPSTVPASRRRLQILHALHRLLQLVLLSISLWLVYVFVIRGFTRTRFDDTQFKSNMLLSTTTIS